MLWFKILLIVLLALCVIGDIRRIGGWEPKPSRPRICAVAAIGEVLLALGIWYWL